MVLQIGRKHVLWFGALWLAAGLAAACTDNSGTNGTDAAAAGGAETATGAGDAGGKDTTADSGKGGDSGNTETAPVTDSEGSDAPADTAPDVAETALDTADGTVADDGQTVDDSGAEVVPVKDTVTADTQVTIVPGEYKSTCTAGSDCVNPCVTTASSCVDGKCVFKPYDKACLIDIGGGKVECIAAGGLSKSKPCLACQDGLKKAQLSANTWLLPMDDPSEGMIIKDTKGGGIQWNYTDKKAVSNGKSLWFGDPAKGTYANNKTVGATATSPAVTVPNLPNIKPKINFWLWLDTEGTQGDDLLTVAVLADGATTTVWTSDKIDGSTHGSWQRINIDAASFAGKQVQLILDFATKDGALNAFGGAYVDDLALATGCCAADGECDDGNACTTDTCKGEGSALPVCKNDLKAACCSNNADCDDKLPCTLDLCSGAGGTCSHPDIPNCCVDDAGCDDNDTCTVDICPAKGGLCQHQNKCCKSDSECASPDPCKKGTCASGQCAYADTCCLFNGDCDDFNPCTTDACDKGKCVYTSATVPGCCSPQVLNSLFAGSDEGWSFKSTHPNLKWAYKDGATAKTGPGALKLADPTKDNNAVPYTNPAFKVTAVSPTITVLPGKETMLSFWTYHASGNGTSYSLRLYVVIDGVEITLSTIYSYQMTNTWKQTTWDLTPLGGKAFELNFEVYATQLSGNYQALGVYLDDVTVTSTCQAKKCTASSTCTTAGFNCLAGVCSDGQCGYANSCCATDKDCNDNSLCTSDTCNLASKKCSFAPIKGCCMGAGDCNDGSACTQDICPGPGGQCSNPAIAGCCLSSTQCNDNNNCTIDKCVSNKCVNEISCCAADKDCADGETKCTIDTCVAGKCVHKPTGAPGCCEPDVWVNDFDGGTLKDITIQNSTGDPTKGWQLTASPPGSTSKTAPGVLYYGNVAQGSFDFGATNGKATTPKILLPAATASKLTLSILMDTESGGKGSYDDMYVYVYAGTQKLTAWDKGNGIQPNKWYDIVFDLAPYAGQEIQVEFFFNTIDSVGNGGKGVFVDDLKIQTNCGG